MSRGPVVMVLLTWLSYVVSRLFRRKELPELVAFLLVGAAVGPSGLNLIGRAELQRLLPLTQVALAVLMFAVGERVSKRALSASRWVVTAGLAQFVLSAVAVHAVSRKLGASEALALLLATVAGAGAPMTIASVVSSTRARGPYPLGLVGVHAVADGLAALAFAAVLPLAELLSGPRGSLTGALLAFARRGVGGALLGVLLGWVVARLGRQIETSGELLLFVLVHILLGWAASGLLGLSLPLAALVMGGVAASLAQPDAAQRTFVALRSIEQPLYLIFFALAGAAVHVESVPELGILGAGYIAARTAAKLVGGLLGGTIGGLGIRRAVRLGADLVPQAGVAVGLAVLAAERLPGPGGDMATVVLGSVVVFELAGPLLVARGLAHSRSEDRDHADGVAVLEERQPSQVLVAGREFIELPAWLLEWCERSGAGLAALGPRATNGEVVRLLCDRAESRGISLRWMGTGRESFTGAVLEAAGAVGADMVVLLVSASEIRERSRLVLHPHERVARSLGCTVVVVPCPVGSPPPHPVV